MFLCEPSIYFLYQVFRNLKSAVLLPHVFRDSQVGRLTTSSAASILTFPRREVPVFVISMSLCPDNTTSTGHTPLHHPRSRVGRPAHHSGTMSVLPVLTQYLAIPPIGRQCSQTSFWSACTESDEWLDIATCRRSKLSLQLHQQIKSYRA